MTYAFLQKKTVAALMLAYMIVAGLALIVLADPGDARGVSADCVAPDDRQGETALSESSSLPPRAFLPLIGRKYEDGPRSFRVGYCSTQMDITRYPDIRELKAGWYLNFEPDADPEYPLGMDHVQVVRLHQLTTCFPDKVRDREECPYVEPYAYTLTHPPTKAALRTIVEQHRGELWLIGNEIDRHDWGGVNPWNSNIVNPVNQWQGQDEIMPELYAQAYHDVYQLIKDADPRALVANGGVIQATPARLEYMTSVWDAYRDRYGQDMPVDVWNVHNFILKERCDDFGADVPPGYDHCKGTVYDDDEHDDMDIFDQQIRAFRAWMKERGQQNKPLIVSEYGILYEHAGMEDPDVVREFMLSTFDYFMNEKDCALGYPADDCRLVQRWAWFSLDSRVFNQYARLFDPWNRTMTGLGEAFSGYTGQHLDMEGSVPPPYWPRSP